MGSIITNCIYVKNDSKTIFHDIFNCAYSSDKGENEVVIINDTYKEENDNEIEGAYYD
tara:strand:- start:1105 stop:1278 length:174 start_codon:yes stop_codon:yes gene_type:complete